MTKDQARRKAAAMLEKIGTVLTPKEKRNIEIVELGLGMLETIGCEIVTYVNTARVCAKEIVLFPWQICPEHRHPQMDDDPGKEETFRCRSGVVYLYVPGKPVRRMKARLPKAKHDCFTVFHEIVLKPGDQYTLKPNTWHWFQAGGQGAVVSEFSTRSRDEHDVFTDKAIRRV